MADRARAHITIGGSRSAERCEALAGLIATKDLRVKWGAEPFGACKIEDQPLPLYADEVAWGLFEALEQYCCGQRIAFQLGSGACHGSFGAGRIVSDGRSGPLNYAVDDDGRRVLQAANVERLASIRVITRYVAEAEIEIAAFIVDACA